MTAMLGQQNLAVQMEVSTTNSLVRHINSIKCCLRIRIASIRRVVPLCSTSQTAKQHNCHLACCRTTTVRLFTRFQRSRQESHPSVFIRVRTGGKHHLVACHRQYDYKILWERDQTLMTRTLFLTGSPGSKQSWVVGPWRRNGKRRRATRMICRT